MHKFFDMRQVSIVRGIRPDSTIFGGTEERWNLYARVSHVLHSCISYISLDSKLNCLAVALSGSQLHFLRSGRPRWTKDFFCLLVGQNASTCFGDADSLRTNTNKMSTYEYLLRKRMSNPTLCFRATPLKTQLGNESAVTIQIHKKVR